MLVYVPDPVCQITKGNYSSNLPSITSSQAFSIASPISLSNLYFILTIAEAFFNYPNTLITYIGILSIS